MNTTPDKKHHIITDGWKPCTVCVQNLPFQENRKNIVILNN